MSANAMGTMRDVDEPVIGSVGTRAINERSLLSYVAPLAPMTMFARSD